MNKVRNKSKNKYTIRAERKPNQKKIRISNVSNKKQKIRKNQTQNKVTNFSKARMDQEKLCTKRRNNRTGSETNKIRNRRQEQTVGQRITQTLKILEKKQDQNRPQQKQKQMEYSQKDLKEQKKNYFEKSQRKGKAKTLSKLSANLRWLYL